MRAAIFFAILTFALRANASSVAPLLSLQYEGGGNSIDLHDPQGSSITFQSGRGAGLSVGLIFALGETYPSRYELQLTQGFKADQFEAKAPEANGQVTFVRYPLEAISFYRDVRNGFRVGTGVTYQFGNLIDGENGTSVYNSEVQNAFGWISEADVLWPDSKVCMFGVRYTKISYDVAAIHRSVDGSSFGGAFTCAWY